MEDDQHLADMNADGHFKHRELYLKFQQFGANIVISHQIMKQIVVNRKISSNDIKSDKNLTQEEILAHLKENLSALKMLKIQKDFDFRKHLTFEFYNLKTYFLNFVEVIRQWTEISPDDPSNVIYKRWMAGLMVIVRRKLVPIMNTIADNSMMLDMEMGEKEFIYKMQISSNNATDIVNKIKDLFRTTTMCIDKMVEYFEELKSSLTN